MRFWDLAAIELPPIEMLHPSCTKRGNPLSIVNFGFGSMTSRVCSLLALLLLVVGAERSDAKTPQSVYDSMQKVFDVCVANARSGTSLTDEKSLAEADLDWANERGDNSRSLSFSIETNEDFGCVVWIKAGQFNAIEFRKSMDSYIPSLFERGKENKCVWRTVFPINSCTLAIEKNSYEDGWERHFSISFRIVAHEYAAMIIRQTLAFDPDGFAHLPRN
jgi:hypothetical protein